MSAVELPVELPVELRGATVRERLADAARGL